MSVSPRSVSTKWPLAAGTRAPSPRSRRAEGDLRGPRARDAGQGLQVLGAQPRPVGEQVERALLSGSQQRRQQAVGHITPLRVDGRGRGRRRACERPLLRQRTVRNRPVEDGLEREVRAVALEAGGVLDLDGMSTIRGEVAAYPQRAIESLEVAPELCPVGRARCRH